MNSPSIFVSWSLEAGFVKLNYEIFNSFNFKIVGVHTFRKIFFMSNSSTLLKTSKKLSFRPFEETLNSFLKICEMGRKRVGCLNSVLQK